jgi:hypothetical protein
LVDRGAQTHGAQVPPELARLEDRAAGAVDHQTDGAHPAQLGDGSIGESVVDLHAVEAQPCHAQVPSGSNRTSAEVTPVASETCRQDSVAKARSAGSAGSVLLNQSIGSIDDGVDPEAVLVGGGNDAASVTATSRFCPTRRRWQAAILTASRPDHARRRPVGPMLRLDPDPSPNRRPTSDATEAPKSRRCAAVACL